MSIFTGVNGVAREVKEIYVGVDGIARKVKEVFIGDEKGIARLAWSAEITYERVLAIASSSGVAYYIDNIDTTPTITASASTLETRYAEDICYNSDDGIALASFYNNYISRSLDGGVTWTNLGVAVWSPATYSAVVVLKYNKGVFLAYYPNIQAVAISTDNGSTWNVVTLSYYVRDIAVYNGYFYMTTSTTTNGNVDKILKSTNGVSWSTHASGLSIPQITYHIGSFEIGNGLFVIAYDTDASERYYFSSTGTSFTVSAIAGTPSRASGKLAYSKTNDKFYRGTELNSVSYYIHSLSKSSMASGTGMTYDLTGNTGSVTKIIPCKNNIMLLRKTSSSGVYLENIISGVLSTITYLGLYGLMSACYCHNNGYDS